MSAPHIFCNLSAKNYQNWWKFDEVLTKTILHRFLRHGVLYFCFPRLVMSELAESPTPL